MTNRQLRIGLAALCLSIFAGGATRAADVVADFDDLALAPNSAFQGPMPNAVEIQGRWGPEMQGTFNSGDVDFINQRNTTFGSWSGFAYSNMGDATTEGWLNQFSVYTGAARSGDNFGVAFGYHDLEANIYEPEAFDPLNIEHLLGLPYFTLPTGGSIEGMFVTNTTYTALSLILGDSFTGRPFGGDDGSIPDWYKMSAYGIDASGDVLKDAAGKALVVDYFLADNRLGQMFIADQWEYMDLSTLAGAQRISFNVSGTLTGPFGLNTPGYFAVDDIHYTVDAVAVPEPTSLAMAGGAILAILSISAVRQGRSGLQKSQMGTSCDAPSLRLRRRLS